MDLSLITITRVVVDRFTLTVNPPLVLTPTIDSDGDLVVEDESLDLWASGADRDELIRETETDLAFNWHCYVEDAPPSLTPRSVEIRKALKARFARVDA